MLRILTATLAFATLMTATAQAQDAKLFRRHTQSSCSARSIDRYYCPWFGSGQFNGPYFDNGCSVKCKSGEQAVCHEATCEDGQTGQPVYSSCSCN